MPCALTTMYLNNTGLAGARGYRRGHLGNCFNQGSVVTVVGSGECGGKVIYLYIIYRI
jgi:hypothetical protein